MENKKAASVLSKANFGGFFNLKGHNKKIRIVLASIICSLVVVGFLTAYAYFITSGTKRNMDVDLRTGTMGLVFSDRNNGIEAVLDFGESVEKTFTLENVGTLDAVTTMYWENLVNNYVSSSLGGLTYTLEYSTTPDGEYKKLINNKNIPSTIAPSETILAEGISVPAKQKYYYKLTITLNDLEYIDQTADNNGYFSSQFKIGEGSIQDVPFNVVDAVIAMENDQIPKGIKPGTPNFNSNNQSSIDLIAYNDFVSVENDPNYPFEFVDEKYVSTNNQIRSSATYSFSPKDEISGVLCRNLEYDSSDLFLVYVDNIEKTSTIVSEECIDLGKINSSNKVTVKYIKNSKTDGKVSFGVTKSVIRNTMANYSNLINIKNDDVNPFNKVTEKYEYFVATIDEVGITSTMEFSVGDNFDGNLEYHIPSGDDFKVYLDNTLLESFEDEYGEAVELHNITPNNKIKVEYTKKSSSTEQGMFALFSTILTEENDKTEAESGVYAIEDDYGTSYYFRGDVHNNYLRFGPYYWRVIRINGDGSVRIMYDGTEAHLNNNWSSDRVLTGLDFNKQYDDVKYVGYMYGPANPEIEDSRNTKGKYQLVPLASKYDIKKVFSRIEYKTEPSTSKEQADSNVASSSIKLLLEDWYQENIVANNADQYVADTLFCYDRSIAQNISNEVLSSLGEGAQLGYGKSPTFFGAVERNIADLNSTSTVTPSLKCPNKNDAFTKSDSVKGNAKISEKVGLITADEVVIAGGSANTNSGKSRGSDGSSNSNNYLYRTGWYWTGSPCAFESGVAEVISVQYGDLISPPVSKGAEYVSLASDGSVKGAVIPVINLSREYVKTMRGSGLPGDEYVGDAVWSILDGGK